jgi:hypothetical protein
MVAVEGSGGGAEAGEGGGFLRYGRVFWLATAASVSNDSLVVQDALGEKVPNFISSRDAECWPLIQL